MMDVQPTDRAIIAFYRLSADATRAFVRRLVVDQIGDRKDVRRVVAGQRVAMPSRMSGVSAWAVSWKFPVTMM